MRKLLYFLAFLFIACAACDSKNEPEIPPMPPKPKPEPISPEDSIDNLLEGYWDIDSVETFNFGMKPHVYEYVLIGYSKVKYYGNEQLKLDFWIYRKENGKDYFSPINGTYGMKGDTAYVYSYKYGSTFEEYTTYHYSNMRVRIYKTEIKDTGMYGKDSIISVHRKTKKLPK